PFIMDGPDLGLQRLGADAEVRSDYEEEQENEAGSSDYSSDDEGDQTSISDPEDFINDASLPARWIAISETLRRVKGQLRRVRDEKRRTVRASRRKQSEIQRLRAQVRALQEVRHGHLHTTVLYPNENKVWPRILDLWKDEDRRNTIYQEFAHLNIKSYEDIYMLSIKEGNMSAEKTHPDLQLHEDWPFNEVEEDQPLMTGCRSLPLEIQAKVLFHCFSFSKTIHAVSRLPISEPDMSDIPRNKARKLIYFRRFHFGTENDCHRPDKLLAPLLVNKNWHFWGCHYFYGNNTFAFSSLGEFERFAKGIGGSKIKLLTSLELLWTGCQFLTNRLSLRKRCTSRRTDSLQWLPQCIRLESLTIWVQESDRAYQRRRHETSRVIDFMNRLTLAQPNKRARRSLRCLQGIDYVYCLRGLKEIQVFDYDKRPMKVAIADESFRADLENSVARKKEHADHVQSKLMNLPPLIPEWEPERQVWQCLEMLQYQGRRPRTRRSSFDMDSSSFHEDESDSDGESWDSRDEPSDSGDETQRSEDEETMCGDETSESDDDSSGRPDGGHSGIRTSETIDLTSDDDEEDQDTNAGRARTQPSSMVSSPLFVENSHSPPKITSPSVKEESRGATRCPVGSPDGSSESSLFVPQSPPDGQNPAGSKSPPGPSRSPPDDMVIDLTSDSDAENDDGSPARKRSSDEEAGSVTPKRQRQGE
ncbi:hypothetical protein CP532_5940, partial [Ophiocordyceps camponoti-leonardi (nom. inval.)]